MMLKTALKKLRTIVYLGVGMLARDVAAIMPGRAVQVMEVMPMPAQAAGGVSDKSKASADATTATASPPKLAYCSLFSAVTTQTVVAASVSLATGSAVAGGVYVLLSGTMVDAANVSTDPTCDDKKTCNDDGAKTYVLWGLAMAAGTKIFKAFKILSTVKEVDDVARYVHARALPFWLGLVGVVDFMMTL